MREKMREKTRQKNVLSLRGPWQLVSFILLSVLQVFSYLATSFFLIQFLGMLIQTIFALRSTGKTDVVINCLIFSSSSLEQSIDIWITTAGKSELWDGKLSVMTAVGK